MSPRKEPLTLPPLGPMARVVLQLARQEAARAGSPEARPEDLLVGLINANVAPASVVLRDQGVDVRLVRSAAADHAFRFARAVAAYQAAVRAEATGDRPADEPHVVEIPAPSR